jgi:hypothetical protein
VNSECCTINTSKEERKSLHARCNGSNRELDAKMTASNDCREREIVFGQADTEVLEIELICSFCRHIRGSFSVLVGIHKGITLMFAHLVVCFMT